MTNFNGFKGRAKRLDDVDLPRIGHQIGVGEDELHAFMDVETAGGGFDAQGRPKILFEPHVFYRNLAGAERDKAVAAGFAYPKLGTKPYGKPSEQYPKLLRAMKINETAALKACSWGLGQILGENAEMVGFDSPQAMVLAFMDDEETHLDAIVQFLIKSGIDDDLREHRWTNVARVYNGPGYAKNKYDTKMAAAFAKWSKIRDTAWSPDAKAPTKAKPKVAKPAAPAPGMTSFEIEALQRQLQAALYTEVGFIDGKWGSRTIAALSAFQSENGLPVTGAMDDATRAFIERKGGIPKRAIAAARADATAESLAKQGNLPAAAQEAQKGVFWSKLQAAAGVISAFLYAVWGNIGTAISAVTPLKDDLGAIAPWLFIAAVIGFAAIMYLKNSQAITAAVTAVRKGQDTGV